MNKKCYRKIALTLVLIMLLVISSVFSSPVKAETNGNIVYITDTGSKYHLITCPHLGQSRHAIRLDDAISQGYEPCNTCKPFAPKAIFKDVPLGHEFYPFVMDLVARNITGGYGDGHFGEKDPITRAQIAVMLVRARPDLKHVGMKSEFRDVPAGYWAEGEIAAAKKAGILDGYGDGRFGPDDNITRAQLSKMVANAFNIKADTKNPVKFSDVSSTYWAEEYISALASNNIVGGYGGGLFRPDYRATRGQFSKYLSNVLSHVEASGVPVFEDVVDKTITLNFVFGTRTGQYTGELVNGLPQGHGTFSTANEVGQSWEYTGEWRRGHMEGEGTTTWESGQVYIGTYQQDLFIQGKALHANGMKYEGSLADDLYHGNGTLYDYHGEVIYSGLFDNGYFLESASEYVARKNNIQAKSRKECSVYDLKELCHANEHEYCEVWGEVLHVEQYANNAFIQILDQAVNSRDRVISIDYNMSVGETLPELGDLVSVWGTTQYMYSYEAEGGFDMNTPLMWGLVIEIW